MAWHRRALRITPDGLYCSKNVERYSFSFGHAIRLIDLYSGLQEPELSGDDSLVVGRVLDAAVSAGSNTIQEVTFDLKDAQPQKTWLRPWQLKTPAEKQRLRQRPLA
jgi:hypothetical protein